VAGRCERCGAKPEASGSDLPNLHDYCATCSRNLCEACMAAGCCGTTPAVSGQATDDTPPCPDCFRSIGHARTCPRRAPAKGR
jgi:hypothetical protein